MTGRVTADEQAMVSPDELAGGGGGRYRNIPPQSSWKNYRKKSRAKSAKNAEKSRQRVKNELPGYCRVCFWLLC